MTVPSAPAREWRDLRPDLARTLVDARLQLHHAAQLVAGLGISYLPAQPDDSHTNMEWLESVSALASKEVNGSTPIRLAVSPYPFTLLLLAQGEARATLPLHGRTMRDAVDWVRGQFADCGLHTEAYTQEKHYTIPPHPVAESAAFDDGARDAFVQLGAWYSDGARTLERIASTTPNASPVRCWPHHFDIATLVQVAPGKTISLGMEPGDDSYGEPYVYASMYPAPSARELPPLDGGGAWHTQDWIGAVLPGSTLGREAQREQIEAFIDSAVRACRELLLSH